MWWARAAKKLFGSSGMDKSGTQTIASSSTWTKLTSWAVRAGFPDTVIESDGIRVPVGQVVNYAGQVVFSGTSNGSTASMSSRIVNGATVIDTKSVSAIGASTGTFSGSFTGTGELVTVEAWTNSLASSRNIIAVTTYMTFSV